MFANRILEYGYPKFYDGKNMLGAIDLRTIVDINVSNRIYMWTKGAQYYFAAIGAFFAKNTGDIYAKTAILRIPFALIGLLGLIIMVLGPAKIFRIDLTSKLIFFIFFVFFELLSVSLVLHLREMRYYSPVIFISACILYVYINYVFLKNIKATVYALLMTLLLTVLFNTFSPVYVVFIIAVAAHQVFKFAGDRDMERCAVAMLPLMISGMIVIVSGIFLKAFGTLKEASFYNINLYAKHIFHILQYFTIYEFLPLALAIKIILFILWLRYKKIITDTQGAKEGYSGIKEKKGLSNFLSLFFVIYLAYMTSVPFDLSLTRYYIVLQPILTIVLILDIFVIAAILNGIKAPLLKRRIRPVVLLSIFIIFNICLVPKVSSLKGHIYEIGHQYKGPLDFVIPYIKANYEKPEKLIIATNYEEFAYMYYLGSRTIFGWQGMNLKEDMKLSPDIIIPRKRPSAVGTFDTKNYKKITFPVCDLWYNNIPELNLPRTRSHLYSTKLANNDRERLSIFIK